MKYISVIKAEIESISPLYICDGEDIILDDETGMAYIPATTLAGSFRAYLDSIEKDSDSLFGEGGKNNTKSNVYIKDCFANNKGFEVRTGVKINEKMGSSQDGFKIDRLYLRKGLSFNLHFKIESNGENIEDNKILLYKCLNALDDSLIRIGGNKSTGLGTFKVNKVEEIDFDFNNKNQWVDYIKDNYSNSKDITRKVLDESDYTNFVRFNIKGDFTTPILIGSTESYNPKDVDSKSMMSDGEYIVPGSSFKGILRSRIEKISNYFGNIEVAREMFGNTQVEGKEKNSLSKVFVTESTINTSEVEQSNYNRIKIDKFTGGVRKTGLMNDTPVQGSAEFKVIYKRQGNIYKDKYAIGIIALALRDLGSEDLSIGGNYSIGRGRFKADSMSIIDGKEKMEIDFIQKTISNRENLDIYIKAVKGFNEEVDHEKGI